MNRNSGYCKEDSIMCLLTPESIISLKFGKIENNKKISNLGWGDYKDVLYSFLGIYTLGVYIFAKDKKSRYSIGEDKIIRIAGTKRWLYSRKYIKEHLNEFSELTNTKEIMDFAEVYNSEGNIIPIWPGGNEFKGKAGCYDIPDIFFSKYGNMEEIYIQHILHKNIEDVALTRFITKSPYVDAIEDIFDYDVNKYKEFVGHIVNEIKTRTKEIENLYKQNAN